MLDGKSALRKVNNDIDYNKRLIQFWKDRLPKIQGLQTIRWYKESIESRERKIQELEKERDMYEFEELL